MRAAATTAVSMALVLASTLVSRAAEPTVLVIGDSVSAGYGASAPDRGWPSLLGMPIRGEAAPGMTSAYFVGRMWRAEVAVVELGINDLRQHVPPEVFGDHMREVVSGIQASRVVVVVAYPTRGETIASWDPYASQLAEIAAVDKRVVLVDLRPAFGNPSTALLTSDLIHPNDRGHDLIAKLVSAGIAE